MKNIVILTGAGMSAESGIATFRDSGGLWDQYRVEDVATPEGFAKNPKLVLDFYNVRRRESQNAEPNKGHIGLANLQNEYEVFIITQNVDNLHERAGSKHVLHLHGELMKARSSINPNEIIDLSSDHLDIRVGDKSHDGSQLRPHIVWFGEAVPMITKAEEMVAKADILVIIGTSLNVYPAAGLLYSLKRGTPVYLIDPKEVQISSGFQVTHIKKGASVGVEVFCRLLRENK